MSWWSFLAGVVTLAFVEVVLALAWWLRDTRSLPPKRRGEIGRPVTYLHPVRRDDDVRN